MLANGLAGKSRTITILNSHDLPLEYENAEQSGAGAITEARWGEATTMIGGQSRV
jgi:hypothetical protein